MRSAGFFAENVDNIVGKKDYYSNFCIFSAEFQYFRLMVRSTFFKYGGFIRLLKKFCSLLALKKNLNGCPLKELGGKLSENLNFPSKLNLGKGFDTIIYLFLLHTYLHYIKIKKHSAHSLNYCIYAYINLHKIYHVERVGSRVGRSRSRDPTLSTYGIIQRF